MSAGHSADPSHARPPAPSPGVSPDPSAGRGPAADDAIGCLYGDGTSPSPQVFLNRPAESVAASLGAWLNRAHDDQPIRVHLVTGFVGFGGLACLADELAALLRAGADVRLLLGVAPADDLQITS